MNADSTPPTKTAIVTGAAGGIGTALVSRLVDRGLNVVLVDRNEDALHEVSARLELIGGTSLLIAADVSLENDVRHYVDETLDRFGRIDYFANNAGIEGPSLLIEEQAVETLDRIYAVNMRGSFLGIHFVLPVMKRQRSGAILNTASLAGLIGNSGIVPYTMSKHAIIGLSRGAAEEAAPFGVRVNTVAPGTINTDMMRRIENSTADPAELRKLYEAATPLGRYGEPEEVAAVMSFLLSDEASFVSNSIYTVDGGMFGQ